MTLKIGSPALVVAVSTVAALAIVGVIAWRQKRIKKVKAKINEMKIPSKWIQIGEVGELIMYPLKGAKRKCVSEALCTSRGLRQMDSDKLTLQDRVFVVYNDKGEFMNIKKNTKMLLLETVSESEDSVKFSYPDAEDLVVKIPANGQSMNPFNLYGETVQTVDCGELPAEWFSQRLLGQSTGLRLGCFIESLVPARTIDEAWKKTAELYPKFHSDYLGAYADIASYMLMSEKSVEDLNSKLDTPVTGHHFRPNIMVKGSLAYSEDTWDWIKIGETVVLRSFKYCTRCVVTSVDPDTTEKDPTFEPLRTLRKYRKVKEPHLKQLEGSNPVMGMYAGCHLTGSVRVGDPVYINTE